MGRRTKDSKQAITSVRDGKGSPRYCHARAHSRTRPRAHMCMRAHSRLLHAVYSCCTDHWYSTQTLLGARTHARTHARSRALGIGTVQLARTVLVGLTACTGGSHRVSLSPEAPVVGRYYPLRLLQIRCNISAHTCDCQMSRVQFKAAGPCD